MFLTHDAFLADIIENPDDDAPRVIYADFLDDLDEPERAEFIRLQGLLQGASAAGRSPAARPRRPRESSARGAFRGMARRLRLPQLDGIELGEDFKTGASSMRPSPGQSRPSCCRRRPFSRPAGATPSIAAARRRRGVW